MLEARFEDSFSNFLMTEDAEIDVSSTPDSRTETWRSVLTAVELSVAMLLKRPVSACLTSSRLIWLELRLMVCRDVVWVSS